MWQRAAVPCLVLAALLAATFADRPALAAATEDLTHAVIRAEEMSTLAQRWETAIEHLGSHTIPVDMFNDKPRGCDLGARVTKTGSGPKTIESTKGKVLALVDPASTSGNALPPL